MEQEKWYTSLDEFMQDTFSGEFIKKAEEEHDQLLAIREKEEDDAVNRARKEKP